MNCFSAPFTAKCCTLLGPRATGGNSISSRVGARLVFREATRGRRQLAPLADTPEERPLPKATASERGHQRRELGAASPQSTPGPLHTKSPLVLPLATVLAKVGQDCTCLLGWRVALRAPNDDLLGEVSAVLDAWGRPLTLATRTGATPTARPCASPGRPASTRAQPPQAATPPPAQATLRVSRPAVLEPYGFSGTEEYYVPIDPRVVVGGSVAGRVLCVEPSPELLRAGRRHLVLQYLRQELTAIASSLKDTEGDSSRGDHAGDEQRQYQQALAEALGMAADAAQQQQQQLLRMPSRTQLEALGRGDLVALVAGAGGFAEVASQLGLQGARRPRGFWNRPDSLQVLQGELSAFVASAWVQLPHPDDGSTYYYNQISNRSTWKRPPQPVLVPLGTQPAPAPQAATGAAATNAVHPQPSPLAPPPLEGRRTAAGGPPNAAYADTPQAAVPGPGTGSGPGPGAAPGTVWVWAVPGEAAAERVMPSRALLLQAGRRDLHYAVTQLLGGYAAAAAALRRRPTWARGAALAAADARRELRARLAKVAREMGLPPGTMPSERDLVQAGQGALVGAVRRAGGYRLLAGRLRLAGRRRARGTWHSAEALARELAEFARQHPRGSQVSTPHSQQTEPQHQSQQQQPSPQQAGSDPHSSSHGEGPDNAAAVGDSSADAAAPSPLPLPLPTRSQLREAGRFDLLYALHMHSRAAKTRAAKALQKRQQVGDTPTKAQPTSWAAVDAAGALAALGGLAAPASRRGTNRNALRWEDVEEAVRAGCHSPRAIREHLQQHRRVAVSRQHLTAYLARQTAEGRLAKPSYGRYELPSTPHERPSANTSQQRRSSGTLRDGSTDRIGRL